MSEFLLLLHTFLSPSCWVRNNKTSKHWDKKLRGLLGNPDFQIAETKHTVFLGGNEVWVSNKFYGYGNLYNTSDLLPSRRTAILLSKLHESWLFNNGVKS